ncbi:MAG: hypothetical protein HPY69_05100 [Armatimonadetes bacterium]|nr:hypothetical protein [Armatimonadota bacterium]
MRDPATQPTRQRAILGHGRLPQLVLWGGAFLLLGAMVGGTLSWLLYGGLVSSSIRTIGGLRPPDLPDEAIRPSPIVFDTTPRRPRTTPSLLPAGVPLVYLFYDLTDQASSAPSSVSWLRNGVQLGRVANSDIRPDPGNPGHGMVLLRAPNGSLPPGLYEVRLTVAGERLLASFQVAWGAQDILQQPIPPAVELQVRQVTLARGVKPDGRPHSPVEAVSPDCGRLYFVFRYEQAEPGLAVSVRWFMATQELETARREVVLPSTAGWAHAWVEPEGDWPSGPWRVAAYVSGDTQEIASATLNVR